MKELLNRLEAIITKYELSDAVLISKIGITSDELQALRSGRSLDAVRLQLIRAFIEMLEQDIYPTKLVLTMEKILKLTEKEQAISVIGSISGAGKTLASKRYASENPLADYMYLPEITSPRYLLQLVSAKLQLPSMGLSIQQMYEQICASLANEKRLFIFDEADRLNRKMFEILRDIWQDGKGNVGIAFVGDENLMNKIKRPGTLRENLIRLMRRVKYNEIIDPLHPDDIEMVFGQNFKKHKISGKMIQHIYSKYSALGGFGSILNLTDKISKIADKTKDTPNDEMCTEAMRRLKL
ncbi:MAG: transposase [Chlorobi bacterium OLB5]|nr:MAG: transposase [Chlorobi bacterium OLB5]